MRALGALVLILVGLMTSSASAHQQQRRPVIVITDAGYFSDDSVAILALLQSGQFDVRGIVTTAGNVSAEQSHAALTRLLAETGHADVTLIEGPSMHAHAERWRYYVEHERPTWRRRAYVGAFADLTRAPARQSNQREQGAAAFLVEQARALEGGLTIILLGPATVLAQALSLDPAFGAHIAEVIAMGGAFNVRGNVTEAAEFNIWFDPEALEVVLRAGMRMTIVPLDATGAVRYAKLAPEAGEGASLGFLRAFLASRSGDRRRLAMWDEVVAAMLIEPDLVRSSYQADASVVLDRSADYGRTRADRNGAGSVRVITAVDAKRVEAVLRRTLAGSRG